MSTETFDEQHPFQDINFQAFSGARRELLEMFVEAVERAYAYWWSEICTSAESAKYRSEIDHEDINKFISLLEKI